MKKLNQLFALSLLSGLMMIAAQAQRPRSVREGTEKTDATTTTTPPAPQTVKAKYEGGVFGHNKKQDGTLIFDDTNNRLLFRDKKQRELLFIPYDAITSAFADTQSKRPKSATIASNVPTIFALPARFIKTKVRYLTIQFSDPDSHVSGVTSFKLNDKETLASVLNALAQKASLTPRGEVYVKRRDQQPYGNNNP